MPNAEFNTRIKHKRDSEDNWSANNPILLNGECIIVDMNDGTTRIKIGDGTSSYSSLQFCDDNLRDSIGSINAVPSSTTDDNDKVLAVVNGVPAWITQTYKILPITQDEYNALATKDTNTLYIIEV